METLVGVTQTRFPLSVLCPSSPVARMPEASVAQIERLQRDSPFPSLAAPGKHRHTAIHSIHPESPGGRKVFTAGRGLRAERA